MLLRFMLDLTLKFFFLETSQTTYILTCKVSNGWIHSCQNRDMDCTIAWFYDPISPKRLVLY